MRESDTYQYILEEGRAEGRLKGARRILLRQGLKKFGKPDKLQHDVLLSIADIECLCRLGERLLDVSTWEELLQTP
jgi:hypothetical protein